MGPRVTNGRFPYGIIISLFCTWPSGSPRRHVKVQIRNDMYGYINEQLGITPKDAEAEIYDKMLQLINIRNDYIKENHPDKYHAFVAEGNMSYDNFLIAMEGLRQDHAAGLDVLGRRRMDRREAILERFKEPDTTQPIVRPDDYVEHEAVASVRNSVAAILARYGADAMADKLGRLQS